MNILADHTFDFVKISFKSVPIFGLIFLLLICKSYFIIARYKSFVRYKNG